MEGTYPPKQKLVIVHHRKGEFELYEVYSPIAYITKVTRDDNKPAEYVGECSDRGELTEYQKNKIIEFKNRHK